MQVETNFEVHNCAQLFKFHIKIKKITLHCCTTKFEISNNTKIEIAFYIGLDETGQAAATAAISLLQGIHSEHSHHSHSHFDHSEHSHHQYLPMFTNILIFSHYDHRLLIQHECFARMLFKKPSEYRHAKCKMYKNLPEKSAQHSVHTFTHYSTS